MPEIPSNSPTLESRLFAREESLPGRPMMLQTWHDLLFLHWRIDISTLQSRLPPGLVVDTHAGEAWLGIVPFGMRDIRFSGLPGVTGLRAFPELNVRTYVHDHLGRPGVWFFSLDAASAMAVWGARTFFHLPYQHARMQQSIQGRQFRYSCARRGESGVAEYSWLRSESQSFATLGSLDFFLIERYWLFAWSARRRQLFRGAVRHEPYQVSEATVSDWSSLPVEWDGIRMVGRAPDHVRAVREARVRVFALEKIPTS